METRIEVLQQLKNMQLTLADIKNIIIDVLDENLSQLQDNNAPVKLTWGNTNLTHTQMYVLFNAYLPKFAGMMRQSEYANKFGYLYNLDVFSRCVRGGIIQLRKHIETMPRCDKSANYLELDSLLESELSQYEFRYPSYKIKGPVYYRIIHYYLQEQGYKALINRVIQPICCTDVSIAEIAKELRCNPDTLGQLRNAMRYDPDPIALPSFKHTINSERINRLGISIPGFCISAYYVQEDETNRIDISVFDKHLYAYRGENTQLVEQIRQDFPIVITQATRKKYWKSRFHHNLPKFIEIYKLGAFA
jgi:hypothetical protein